MALESKQVKPTILVAHAIEKTGSLLSKNPIVSVGFVVGDEYGNTLLTHKVNITVNWYKKESNNGKYEISSYGDFEPKYVFNYWLKFEDELKATCFDPMPIEPLYAWNSVDKFITEVEKKYPEHTYNIKFLAYNPIFTTASIDYALEKYVCRPSICKSSMGTYRAVIDPNILATMLSDICQKQITKTINKHIILTNDVVNNAHHVYLNYITTKKYIF
jgi:hypothetical protein